MCLPLKSARRNLRTTEEENHLGTDELMSAHPYPSGGRWVRNILRLQPRNAVVMSSVKSAFKQPSSTFPLTRWSKLKVPRPTLEKRFSRQWHAGSPKSNGPIWNRSLNIILLSSVVVPGLSRAEVYDFKLLALQRVCSGCLFAFGGYWCELVYSRDPADYVVVLYVCTAA